MPVGAQRAYQHDLQLVDEAAHKSAGIVIVGNQLVDHLWARGQEGDIT